MRISKRLLPGRRSGLPKHHLSLEGPGVGDVVFGLQAGVDGGVVMLQVDAEAFEFEGGPEDVLVHAVGLFGPWVEGVLDVDRLKSEHRSIFGTHIEGTCLRRP